MIAPPLLPKQMSRQPRPGMRWRRRSALLALLALLVLLDDAERAPLSGAVLGPGEASVVLCRRWLADARAARAPRAAAARSMAAIGCSPP